MNRRSFLTAAGGVVLFGGASVVGVPMMVPYTGIPPSTGTALAGRRMGMVIDLTRCREDCTACMDACRAENNVAFHGDKELDIHWIRRVDVKRKVSVKEEEDKVRKVLLLCFHCENPPCAQVCPVQATYQREDGIVIVDQHRCIGCRYCMIACPYNARYFNFKENEDWPNKEYPKRSHGVAESCNFCAHLVDQGMQPACVQACQAVGAGALTFGDLNDPESEVARLVSERSTKRIREDLGTEPKVYYIGL